MVQSPLAGEAPSAAMPAAAVIPSAQASRLYGALFLVGSRGESARTGAMVSPCQLYRCTWQARASSEEVVAHQAPAQTVPSESVVSPSIWLVVAQVGSGGRMVLGPSVAAVALPMLPLLQPNLPQ